MNKAIFLDRDGTINADKDYLYQIEDFEFLPKAVDGLKMLQEEGYLLVIMTNQSGIARGYYTEKDFKRLNCWMLQELQNKGVIITKVYYCPHLPDAKIERYRKSCSCRKPAPGMFIKAVRQFHIDLAQSYSIGDKMRDHPLCGEGGCRGYLIGRGERKDVIEKVKKGSYVNIQFAEDVYHCAIEILQKEHAKDRRDLGW